jgi:flagellar hook-length control protein FliK
MTITVMPASSAKTAMPPGQADTGTQDAGGLFASLLGAQIGSLSTALPTQADTGSGTGKSKQDKDSTSADDTAATDNSANMLLAALPLLQAGLQVQPVQDKPTAAPVTSDVASAGIKDSAIDPLLQAAAPQKHPAGLQAQELPGKDAAALQFLPPNADQLASANQAANQAAQAAQQTSQAKTLTISQPMTDPNWSKALGDQVLSMVSMKMDKATIQVNPPQLGPVEVTLKMNGNDQAQVIFTAAVPATREILENNMPKLVSMMASSGIALADAQVSSGQSGNRQQQFNQNQNGRRQNAAGNDEDDTLAAIKSARGILSIFA